MKTVAIISEYNPFHLGHAYHIDQIRQEFGADTAIIAIMSGNYTQRGELAIADAFIRAKTAVDAGVQLVLKLPFPFSASSAERFASAGVSMANRLGVVDYLSFGSECGAITSLLDIARCMNSSLFKEALNNIQKETADPSFGHPKQAEMLFCELFGEQYKELLAQPNNILAIAYLCALENQNSKILPHTIKREGSSFLATDLQKDTFSSARAIRRQWLSEECAYEELFEKTKAFLPASSHDTYRHAIKENEVPTDFNRLSNVALAFLRNILPVTDLSPADGHGGLYNRVQKIAMNAKNIEEVIQRACTKKYTAARIRRVILYALLGITSSEFKEEPQYAQILAMDMRGQQLVKEIKKNANIEILTKPADYTSLSCAARHQAEIDFRADELFHLAKPVVFQGGESFRRTPYLKRTD